MLMNDSLTACFPLQVCFILPAADWVFLFPRGLCPPPSAPSSFKLYLILVYSGDYGPACTRTFNLSQSYHQCCLYHNQNQIFGRQS